VLPLSLVMAFARSLKPLDIWNFFHSMLPDTDFISLLSELWEGFASASFVTVAGVSPTTRYVHFWKSLQFAKSHVLSYRACLWKHRFGRDESKTLQPLIRALVKIIICTSDNDVDSPGRQCVWELPWDIKTSLKIRGFLELRQYTWK
jgi:hypothetical protein